MATLTQQQPSTALGSFPQRRFPLVHILTSKFRFAENESRHTALFIEHNQRSNTRFFALNQTAFPSDVQILPKRYLIAKSNHPSGGFQRLKTQAISSSTPPSVHYLMSTLINRQEDLFFLGEYSRWFNIGIMIISISIGVGYKW